MVLLTTESNTASPVAQDKQGRVLGLGRGLSSDSILQSPHKFKTLKILQCNINGLSTTATKAKLDLLLDIANQHDVQIIALQETKLQRTSNLKVKGYNIYRSDRSTGGGGGLVFLVRDINYQSINITVPTSDLEIQGITVSWRGRPFHIYNAYHPPNQTCIPGNFSTFMNDNTLILGDFNAKHPTWGCSSNNSRGEDLLQLMDDQGFIALNDGTPTHTSFSYNSSEALDISFASSDVFPLCKWSVMESVGSDHLPILVEIRRRQRIRIAREKFWNFSKANWNFFRDSVDSSLSCDNLSEDLNTNWKNLKNIILDKAKAFVPRGNIRHFVPFFIQNAPLLEPLLKKRKQLLESDGNSSDGSRRASINKINAEIKIAYAHLRRSKWIELCKGLDARTPNSKLWKIVKSINREQPQTETSNSVMNAHGQVATDDKSAANLLGSHYQKTSNLKFSCEDYSIKRRAKNMIHGCRNTDTGAIQLSKGFSSQELLIALAFLDLTKSPGPDNIHGQMIENLGPLGKQRLLDIINQSWTRGQIPSDWRMATVIPVRKQGKEASSIDSYRPISLTSIPCKIMEKMILTRLQFFLDLNGLFPSEQYGFRKGHNTIDQILYFCQKVRDAQNLKPTHHTVAALLDFSKAFDKVWKDKLLIKLHDDFNIRGNALVWIADFLRRRTIRVKFNKTFSDPFQLSQGVPQGSVLSPTLFSLFLAGIEKCKPKDVEIGIFADDIVLWSSGNNVPDIESLLNNTLVTFEEYALAHKIVFNPGKSIVTFFTTNKHLYTYKPKLLLNGQALLYEKHPKYLGFVIDQEFTCNRHIDHLVTKARKRLGILKYIAGRDWGADASTLRTTYVTLIRPILEYGFPIYFCASETNLLKLERVQVSAARIILGLRNSCPSDIVLYETDLQPLHFRRKANLIKYFNKLYSYESQNRTSMLLHGWKSNQRLKKHSPFSLVETQNLFSQEVEAVSLRGCIDPSEGLPNVFFHFDLNSTANKSTHIEDHLRQMALEVIGGIPDDAIQVYTDGSRIDNLAGSGIFIKSSTQNITHQQRNPDTCSVFRSELLAINEGLAAVMTLDYDFGELWILSDSRSSLQHLSNWPSSYDVTSTSILLKLKSISQYHTIHLQWVPSHVGIHGNEVADRLAKEGLKSAIIKSTSLTFQELYSNEKQKLNASWRIPPKHQWYSRKGPGTLLNIKCDRSSQTTLARLASGHIKCLSFVDGSKTYQTCKKCTAAQASPEHILQCLGLNKRDITSDPLIVIDFLRVNSLLELV